MRAGTRAAPSSKPSPVPARRGPGQHVRLDALRDLDLPLEPFLGRGRLLQVADVVLERVAHVAGRRRPAPPLRRATRRAAAARRGPRRRSGPRSRAKAPSGRVSRRDSTTTTSASSEKATERASRPCTRPQPGDLVEQLVLGVERGERPPRPAERPVGEAERAALELDPGEARAPRAASSRTIGSSRAGSREFACWSTVPEADATRAGPRRRSRPPSARARARSRSGPARSPSRSASSRRSRTSAVTTPATPRPRP